MFQSNNCYFSYIRVSTLKQGQSGTSIAEQRAAILRYAARFGLTIIRELEERETAAKLGRPVFLKRGVEVHFANESLDLNSRGGRLPADIQAVVAADYIRNLREETWKGFYGRLKQGFRSMPACLGYKIAEGET